ncbi:MAG: aldo/keto reductase [Pedobacter sp.]|nr:MAG: aldo/keto reductase [Pedobacter sp.]
MNYSILGGSDLNVSTIGYGCMSLGHDQATNTSLINTALDAGVNFFDTADIYNDGANETSIGKALKEKRKNVIIASKVGNVRQPDGSLAWNPSKKHILDSIDKSLARLQTDYLDLYQLHGGTIDDPIEETIDAFEQVKKAGKIRWYGISSIRPNVIRQYVDRSAITTVMMQYSLLDRRPEETCLDLLRKNNIGVLARGSLAQGLLAGKPAKSYTGLDETAVSKVQQRINQLESAERKSSHIALQFALNNPAVSSVIVGMRTQQQLNDALSALNSPKLSPQELDQLLALAPAQVYQEHR